MSKLPSNARRAFLRPANQRPLNGLASSRIIGVALPVTIVSTYSTTAHFAPFCPAGLTGAPCTLERKGRCWDSNPPSISVR